MTWDNAGQRVHVSAPDVQGLFAWWIADDPSRVWRVASRYKLSAEEAAMLYGVEAPRRRQVTVVEAWSDDAFQLWADDVLLQERANPYGVIPFVIFPNLRLPKSFWGESDIPPLVEPARELNRALSQLSMIVELSGNPIAVLEGVERAEDIAVQPGAVWELPEQARAYLLDLLQGGGVRLHVDFIDLIYRAIHDLSEAPRTSFGDNPKALSGVALEMEAAPAAAENTTQEAGAYSRLQAPQRAHTAHPGAAHRRKLSAAAPGDNMGARAAPGQGPSCPRRAAPGRLRNPQPPHGNGSPRRAGPGSGAGQSARGGVRFVSPTRLLRLDARNDGTGTAPLIVASPDIIGAWQSGRVGDNED